MKEHHITFNNSCRSIMDDSLHRDSMINNLKMFSIIVGSTSALVALSWIIMVLYTLSYTDPSINDLMMERYLDISFGLLGFTSSLALVYGALVEGKIWLSVWFLGSATVLIGCWSFFFYRKYALITPESMEMTQVSLLIATGIYVVANVPVIKCYMLLDTDDSFLKQCKKSRVESRRGFCQRERRLKTKEGYCITVPIEEDLYNPM